MDKKAILCSIMVIVAIVIVGVFLAQEQKTLEVRDKYCYSGGGFKAPGIDFLGNDILLKCDCIGEVKHTYSGECLDCDYYTCDGEVEYNCYLVNNFSYYNYTTNPDYLKENSRQVACPQHLWRAS